jgi:hypothetical protein
MELTSRELELLNMPKIAQKKKNNKKNVSNNKLDILQNYVFEMQGNDMLPLTYQKQ